MIHPDDRWPAARMPRPVSVETAVRASPLRGIARPGLVPWGAVPGWEAAYLRAAAARMITASMLCHWIA